LPELVADREGLFEKQGIKIVWRDVDAGVDRTAQTSIFSPKGLNPFRRHSSLPEQDKAEMYNACEMGSYCRVQDTLETASSPLQLVNIQIQGRAHALA
jgi:hypothetical protein